MSLHEIHLDNAIVTMVEMMLPRFSPDNIGLMITLDLRANNFKTNYDKSDIENRCSTMITFIFQRPSNYTKVMAFREYSFGDLSPKLNEETEVDLLSDHDSCWSSDGFRILDKDWIEKSNTIGHPRDADVSFFNTFSIFRRPKYVHFKSFKIDRESRKVRFIIDEFINPGKMLSFMKKD